MTDAQRSLEFPLGHDIGWLASEKGVAEADIEKILEQMEYCGMACELCLDKESTHSYSEDRSASTEFQRRYGAYILRDAIVLASDDKGTMTRAEMMEKAEDNLRETYGFRPRGETEVDGDKLHGIVKGLFPDEEILRHHSPGWLPDDALEVFMPGLGIAVEHRDISHYELSEDNDLAKLSEKIEQDEKREKACIENNVNLIVFPYYISLDRDTVGWKIAEIRSRQR